MALDLRPYMERTPFVVRPVPYLWFEAPTHLNTAFHRQEAQLGATCYAAAFAC